MKNGLNYFQTLAVIALVLGVAYRVVCVYPSWAEIDRELEKKEASFPVYSFDYRVENGQLVRADVEVRP